MIHSHTALVQYIGQIEPNLLIKRNDEITLDEIERINQN